MLNVSRLGIICIIIINEFMYAAAYSLCSFIALKHLFFRQVKKYGLFSVCSGAAVSATALMHFFVSDTPLNMYPVIMCFYALHTVIGWLLLTNRKADPFISLVFAQIFSVSVITSIQTAVFSLVNGADKAIWIVTVLYCLAYLLSAGFVVLLKILAKCEAPQPMSRLNMLLLTGTMWIITTVVQKESAMSNYVPDVSPNAAVPAMLILMASSAILLLSVKNSQTKHFRELSTLSEEYMTAQARHFEMAREADTEMRMLRHDMKNHIMTMNGLYNSGKLEELGEYLEQISGTVNELQAVTILGNEVADAIISEKMKSAAMCGADISVSGSLKDLDMPSVQLCTILANLLDNAIEAVKKVPKDHRRIELTAKRTGSFFYICVKNPSAAAVDISPDIPTSTPDSVHHGLGLRSVKKAAADCGGSVELCCREGADGYEFQAEVILPVSAP